MSKLLYPILLAIAGVILHSIYFNAPTKVEIEDDGYFGTGSPKTDDKSVKPFKVAVSDDVIIDLKHRLKNARISHNYLEDSNDFYYGFNSKYLLELRDYWLNNFDWRKQEAIINSFSQFTTQIEGLQVHFLHVKPSSAYKDIRPLLIVHGWPGNVFEFYKFIPILTDPKKHGINVDFAFEIIAPSIPGYGWSEQPKKTGFSQVACARVFRKLMLRLGFNKFYLQGGDWGSMVTSNLAKLYPENVIALHLNMLASMPGASLKGTLLDIFGTYIPSLLFSSKNMKTHNFWSKTGMLIVETGYMHIQATKPDTVGTSLNDSPIGLAAYILEKFSTWTNVEYRALPDGGLTAKFTKDELLTMIMIYWTNGNIVSSQRFYREYFLDNNNEKLGRQYLDIPTAHASCLNELYDRTPVEISRTMYNITYQVEIEDCGHFAAFESPKPLAKSVFEFVNAL